MPVLDSFRLDGKVAVVTGGNRGLGRAFAGALGEAGASIAILARDTARSAAAVRELTDAGIRAQAFRADVARRPVGTSTSASRSGNAATVRARFAPIVSPSSGWSDAPWA